jgi:3-dehydroquinate synthetase
MSASQLARSVQVKVSVVEEDPTEQGRRAVLNLGHTVGHGLERLSGFQLRHGHAVAIGLVAATRIAAASGLAEPELVDRVEAALRAWGLPADCPPLTVGSIWNAMGHDKKRRGRTLRWVLPRAVGEVTIDHEVASETVYRVLVEMGARDESEREGSE